MVKRFFEELNQMKEIQKLMDSPFKQAFEQLGGFERLAQEASLASRMNEIMGPSLSEIARQMSLIGDSQSTLTEMAKGMSEAAKKLTDPLAQHTRMQKSLSEAFRDSMQEWNSLHDLSWKTSIEPIFRRIDPPKLPEPKIFADTFYRQLRSDIERTQAELEVDEELIVYCFTPVGEVVIVEDIGYQNPFLIIIYGRDQEGSERKITGHMHTVQLQLKIVKTNRGREKPKRRIGFLGE